MDVGETLYVSDAGDWRAWLTEHHATKPEIWLVYYTKVSGKPSIPYGEAVDEALCFGWIDSIVKKHGPQSRALRFTPRRPRSKLSPMNAERVRRLLQAGRMAPAGLAVVGDVLDEPFVIPDDILEALQANELAWRNFQAFPESYQRIRVGWIHGSRNRSEVFQQRLDYFIRMTAQNKRFGLLQ
jgi:uncharacterized protein YdeI (YjbR/CyaY-like superfamily)